MKYDLGKVKIIFKNLYNKNKIYEFLDVVFYEDEDPYHTGFASYIYIQKVPSTGHSPTDTTYWMKFGERGYSGLSGPRGPEGVMGPPGVSGHYDTVYNHGSVKGNITLLASSNIQTFTMTGSLNISFYIRNYWKSYQGDILTLIITNEGSYSITWPSSVKWYEGHAPLLTPNGIDIITLYSTSNGTTWYGTITGQNFK